jgi:ABC-2 type transport system ATP-binding protein
VTVAPLLEVRDLTKVVRDGWTMRRACILDGLSLALDEGELFGLVGHNGAGKTTTFKCLLGFLRPTRGEVLFRGRPLDVAARGAIGFLPEQPYFYDYLTVEETLVFYANLHGLTGAACRQRVGELVELLRLGPKRRARLRTLSKGTLQRLGIAQAIVNRPRLLILDEPMSGLDPAGRHHMRELIRALGRDGTTIVFSSHVLPDTEALCSRVGIVARGRLRDVVAVGRDVDPAAWLLAVRRVSAETLATLARVAAAPPARDGDAWQVRLPGADAVQAALDAVRQGKATIERLVPVHASLEERFLAHVPDDGGLE